MIERVLVAFERLLELLSLVQVEQGAPSSLPSFPFFPFSYRLRLSPFLILLPSSSLCNSPLLHVALPLSYRPLFSLHDSLPTLSFLSPIALLFPSIIPSSPLCRYPISLLLPLFPSATLFPCQNADPVKRQKGFHVEQENPWEHTFNFCIVLQPTILMFVEWCKSNVSYNVDWERFI